VANRGQKHHFQDGCSLDSSEHQHPNKTSNNNYLHEMVAEMMEAHEDHMVFARDVLEAKAKADERFARRFAKIIEKHDKNLYGS